MARGAVHSRVAQVSVAPVSHEVAAIADQVRSACARGAAQRIVSAGTWLDAGHACTAVERLEMGVLQGIVSYEPGDLTLTARAATPLAEIARVTAAEHQWLTLAPHGAPGGTIGATIATGSAGPLASAFGTPRDHVLGCEFVTGAGTVVRAGGRVVKNVAGFDLVRLLTGAWGTLGALTEVTVRLRARPEDDITLAVRVTPSAAATAAAIAWRWTRDSEYKPLAAELLSPGLAQRITGSAHQLLLVRLGGNAAFVRGALSALGMLGDSQQVPSSVWESLAISEFEGAIVFRVSTLPSCIGALHERVSEFADALGGHAHSTLTRGVVRCVVPAHAADRLRAILPQLATEATIVGERMPPMLWPVIARRLSSHALAEGVRRAFDPDHIMNSGILGHP